jgi:hypothetical protein
VFLLVAFLVQTALGRSSVVFEIDDNLKPIEVVLPFREFFSQLSGGKIADRACEVGAMGSERYNNSIRDDDYPKICR